MYILEANNIHKAYANHKALDGVSIQVPNGSIFGLLGPNGAGKTTLIRNINQITAPDIGEILFNGEKLAPKHISQIGYLPEERGLYKKMKVGEQAIYLAQLKGISRNDAIKKLKKWFEKYEIGGWWDKKIEELSKGMAQKVQFIVTVLHEPKLLIFDEPFSGFDPVNVELLKKDILEFRDKGTSIIFSTHNMASVEEICDEIALINKSKVVLSGNVKDIQRQFQKNIYNLVYEGKEKDIQTMLPEGFTVFESYSYDAKHWANKIRIDNDSTGNQLLTEVMKHIDISGFQEILPSMNDIFI
ncbi:MAG: ATP-binding cassette domain-containing protein, partial [Bacteroidales bacterium]|nr:ATP-binding cassette domain-containing protein [Bacteroidales bacterium]